MPELPDITVYVEALAARITGQALVEALIVGPNLLRTVAPGPDAAHGAGALGVERQGKRIVIAFEGGLFYALHLMISGRLQWHAGEARVPGRIGLAAFVFANGTLMLTEAGTRKRASLHVLAGADALRALDAGGLDPLTGDLAAFHAALTRENHTLKRALTDPCLFSGIGNAYSDEILHRARLSPFARSTSLTPEAVAGLHRATRFVLDAWTQRLRAEARGNFPRKVTAFRDGMAVHGRYRRPCPVCGAPVQRVVYAESEMNYCAGCQTGGRRFADRSLSRLLHDDWPRRLEDLEG